MQNHLKYSSALKSHHSSVRNVNKPENEGTQNVDDLFKFGNMSFEGFDTDDYVIAQSLGKNCENNSRPIKLKIIRHHKVHRQSDY